MLGIAYYLVGGFSLISSNGRACILILEGNTNFKSGCYIPLADDGLLEDRVWALPRLPHAVLNPPLFGVLVS